MDSSCRCTLNVGGQIFTTTIDTLRSLPNTRLGRLAQDETLTNQKDAELFFDRNPEIMNNLLDLYRTGDLHLPSSLCGHSVERELKFWEIPCEMVKECCYGRLKKHQDDAKITAEIDKFLTNRYDTPAEIQELSSWNKIWLIMERPNLSRLSKVWSAIFISVVFLSVLLYSFETSMYFREVASWVPEYAASLNLSTAALMSNATLTDEYGWTVPYPWIIYSQIAVFLFFLLEYLVRLLTCPCKAYFFRQAKNWFDAFLIVQSVVGFLLEDVVLKDKTEWTQPETDAIVFFYSLMVVRLLRIVYIARNIDTMKILLLSTKASLKVLLLLAICVSSLATLFGSAVFLAEVLSDHFTMSSIPYGMWYAIVTMTTVGYGDLVPASSVGRLIGTLCALSGVIVMALPIAVIASNFTCYHDNMSTRQQMRTRMAFLKENPDFRRNEVSEKGKERNHRHLRGGKHAREDYDKKSDTDVVEKKQGEMESCCLRFGSLSKPENKGIRNHKIHVSDSRSHLHDDGTDVELYEGVSPSVRITHFSTHVLEVKK